MHLNVSQNHLTTILISKNEKHEFDVSTFVDLYHRAWSKNWVVNFTAEVTFLNFFAKATGIMYFIHPCKELAIPWANFFQSGHNEAATVNTCCTFFIEFLQKWNFGPKSYSKILIHALINTIFTSHMMLVWFQLHIKLNENFYTN